MQDILMCKGIDCPMKDACYRYTARPSWRQRYFLTTPIAADGTCVHFWARRPDVLDTMVTSLETKPDAVAEVAITPLLVDALSTEDDDA